jgi:hypothetical protein
MTMGRIQGTLTLPRRSPLAAGRLKVTITLDATELNAITAPEGKPRVSLRIRLPDRTVTADIAEKSLRTNNVCADIIVLVLQGRPSLRPGVARDGKIVLRGIAQWRGSPDL